MDNERKIVSVIGTRPNIIKMAPLHKELLARGHKHVIVHTGQHYDNNMSKDLFTEFDLPEPDYELGVKSGHLTTRLSNMLMPITDILAVELPDWVLVYGDTLSSLAGGLASVQNRFKTAHVEAGIRNDNMLITEHFDRVILDRICQLNFCATELDYLTLRNECIGKTARQVGDVMYDLFLAMGKTTSNHNLEDRVLMTLHRPENVDDPARLQTILDMIGDSQSKVIWPIHPRAKLNLKRYNIRVPANLELTEPRNYHDMAYLLQNCHLVITDSGGLQKEAYWAKKPCIVVFNDVVWHGIFQTGNQAVVKNLADLPGLILSFRGTIHYPNLFGDGTACKQIVDELEKEYSDSVWES